MKKLIAVVSILLLLTSCNPIKIAYVDVEEIMKEYQGALDAETEIKAESEKMAMQIEQLRMSFQQKVQEYQSSLSSLSEKAKQEKEMELMKENQQIQQGQQMVQQQIQGLGQSKIIELNEKIDMFLEEYAKSKGYSFILGTSQQTKVVMYGDKTFDITTDVIKALNESYESKSKSEEKVEKEPEVDSDEKQE